MSHYAKLATLAFRITAVMLLVYGLLASIVLVKAAIGMGSASMMLPGLAALVIAAVFYLVAPALGRFAAFGLSSSDGVV